MVFMTNVLSGFFFVAFSYWLVTARTRRQSVLNVINGLIKTALNSINSVRTALSNFYQQATWPVALINQAKATVTQMIGQYRSAMQNIFTINLRSATLPNPVGLESAMRNHQTNDFPTLTSSFGITYGGVPFLTATAVVASIESQALTQKMLAAELRQEAARLAHENALRKRGANMTGDVNTQILNLLQRK